MRHLPAILLFAIYVGQASASDPVPITSTTVSPKQLSEVVDGAGSPLPVAVSRLPIEFFNDYSWRMFIALNWPAKVGVRGQADATKSIKDTDGPRVWETWKTSIETIPPKGKQPTEWTSFDAVVPVNGIPEAGAGKKRIFGSFTQFGDISQADFGSLAGPLVCQNKTFVHFEIHVNQAEFEFIRSERLYDRSVLDGLATPKRFPNGSIQIKAAWREFTCADSDSVRKRYYRITADVIDYRTKVAVPKELGLIGMHIVQRTPLRPQWVWTSFEHVDNVPAIGQPPSPGSRFSLNDPLKAQTMSPTSAPDEVTGSSYLSASGEPIIKVLGAAVDTPMQVIREVTLHPQTVAMNTRYQNKLAGTIWANYMLVVTQWPNNTNVPSGNPFPTEPSGSTSDLSVTNTSMETYFQSSTSCMGCHGLSSKLEFVFFPQVHAQNRNPGVDGSPTRTFVEGLNSRFDELRKSSKINHAKRLDQK
jgi:hypothetical protein